MSRTMKPKEKGEDILATSDQPKDPDVEHKTDQDLTRRKLPPRQVKVLKQHAAQEAGGSRDGRFKPGGEPEKLRQNTDEMPSLSEPIENKSKEFETTRFLAPKAHRGFKFKKEALLAKAKEGSLFDSREDAEGRSENGPLMRFLPNRVMANDVEANDVEANDEEANDEEEEEEAVRHHAAATQIEQLLFTGAAKLANQGMNSGFLQVRQESTGTLSRLGIVSNEDVPAASLPSCKRPRVVTQTEDVIEIKDDEEEEEEDVTAIAELASKKMRLEVEVKKQELKSLKVKKQVTVDEVTKISSELEAIRELIEKGKESLKQHKKEEKSYKKQAEAFEVEIQVLQQKKDDVLKLKAEKRELARSDQVAIYMREEQGTRLERKLEEVKVKVQKFDQEIADLPAAPGYSQDMLNLLDSQITAKRSELECPVCFEESAPPIYTCISQHLVCANCR